jgi:hypothetical protein
MIITIQLGGRTLALTAPLGAAAFAVDEGKGTAKIIFAMLAKGENGLNTINRVRSTATTLQWRPVAARPEGQTVREYSKDAYVQYTLVQTDGVWSPATDALANFMKVMQGAQSMPATPPSALGITLAEFSKPAKR